MVGAAAEAPVRDAGPLPTTWRVATGRPGGCHLLFAHGTWLPMVPNLFPAVGLRAEGSVSILPPSRHWTGRRYRWTTPPTAMPLGPLPNWLIERALARAPELPGEEQVAEVAADALLARQSWGFRPTLGAALGFPKASALELLALLRQRVDRMAAGDERAGHAD